ncbi:L,D-transpeptidase catalytic domain [Sporobacter termitidis DSM 10068]|uniref:L,D-transpeptidase catalytic domain n=1 Tax=Sporobacter termitidis DSM 10068 TaxID=1123282 RepID=A0A1M5UHT0_9FIRM|nr:L,D-transpeptidase [Sporobacter termitidis]SHH62622.1 L,D-transpeptidase catalytic domain [Sporobacter termitidis DSM 10068]
MKKATITVLFIHILILFAINPAAAAQDIICEESAVSIKVSQQEKSRIQAIVKTGYAGDYTLDWAKTHDYKESEKVKWVNIKGYSSKTKYLIWVSVAYQRLNVFTGSSGNWNLSRTFIIGTGARGRDTPTGTWKIINKQPKGWTTPAYSVKPVITFINEKYGFHSRLYYPGSAKLYDGRIGFPCSHGCIRMFSSDVSWLYENVPLGTTVVVY